MRRLVAVSAALLITCTVSQFPVQAESAPLMIADFKMKVADLVALSRFVAEDPDAPELKIRPDVNCDGVVTMQDVAVASGWIAEAGTAYDWVFSNQQYWMPDYDRICRDVAARYGVDVSDLVGFSGYDRYEIWQAYGSSNVCIEVCFSEVYDGDRGWCFTSQDPYFNGLGFEDKYYDGDTIMSVFVYDTEHWTDDGFSERWDVPVTRESHLLYDCGSHTFTWCEPQMQDLASVAGGDPDYSPDDVYFCPDLDSDGFVTDEDVTAAMQWNVAAKDKNATVYADRSLWYPLLENCVEEIQRRFPYQELMVFSSDPDTWVRSYAGKFVTVELRFSDYLGNGMGWCFSCQDPKFSDVEIPADKGFQPGDRIMSVIAYEFGSETRDNIAMRFDMNVGAITN